MDKNTKKQFTNTEVSRNNSNQDLFELQQIDRIFALPSNPCANLVKQTVSSLFHIKHR